MLCVRSVPLATVLLLTATLHADDWLRFRGPNGAGVSDSTSLPTEFGPDKNLAWKAAIPFSRSSVVVSAEHVFATANEGDTLMTLCLDRNTGKILWRRELQRTRAHEVYEDNDATSPSPTSDGNNVYVFYPDFGLLSYGPDGNERWRLELGPFENFYGMSASPIVAGGTVYLLCDQLHGSFLIAVDTDSGEVLWKRNRPGQGLGYLTPVIHYSAVVATGSSRVEAYAADTSEPVWGFRQTGFPPQGVPLFDGPDLLSITTGASEPIYPPHADILEKFDANGDKLIARAELTEKDWVPHFGYFDRDHDGLIDTAGYDAALKDGVGEYGLVRVKLSGKGEVSSEAVGWRYKKGLPYVPAPLVYDGVLYLVKNAGIITALDPKSGKVLKAGRTREAMGTYYASPVAGAGKVILASKEGKVTVLRAGPEWEILAVNDLGEEIYGTPAIVGNTLYVRTRAAVYAFRYSSAGGTSYWKSGSGPEGAMWRRRKEEGGAAGTECV